MRFEASYSHHHGVDVWQDRDLYEWITDLFEIPNLMIGDARTTAIRDQLKSGLEKEGWAFNVRVDAEADLSVFAKNDDLVIQLQTGNISRYAYDLLKIQHLYAKKEISAAALAVPTKKAAQLIGSNITNAERVWNELQIFNRFITVPMMLIAFE